MEKPSNVNAAGALLLAGGIVATLVSLAFALGTLGLWLPWIYGVIAGIYSIVKGAQLLNYQGPGSGPPPGVPTAASVMLIVNVLNCDMMSMTLGIVSLALLNDAQTRAYLEGNTSAFQNQQQGAGVGMGYGHQQQQAPQAQQQQNFQTAPAAPFVPPPPASWGPPPQSAPPTEQSAPSWKSSGWGAQPFASPDDPPIDSKRAPTLKEDASAPVWDDMADWERRFSETAAEEEVSEVAEVGAGAWKKD